MSQTTATVVLGKPAGWIAPRRHEDAAAAVGIGPLYRHTGELPGYKTFAGYDPARKLTVVGWAATAPSPDGRAPTTTLTRTIIGGLDQPGG